MQDLWEGEEHILKFYSHSCPKLYEMDTIAYWIIEKKPRVPYLHTGPWMPLDKNVP